MSDQPPAFSWIAFARSVSGFLVAPPLTGFVVGGLNAVVYGASTISTVDVPTSIVATLVGAGVGSMAGAMYGIPVAFIAGWPVHLLLLQIRFTGLFVYGCFAGSLAVMAITYVFGLRLEPSFHLSLLPLETALIVAATGWLSGAIFWLIRRPDRDAVSASPTP